MQTILWRNIIKLSKGGTLKNLNYKILSISRASSWPKRDRKPKLLLSRSYMVKVEGMAQISVNDDVA
jgi:hypothetical protein